MANIDLKLTDTQISKLTKQEFKIIIKKKIRLFAFLELENIKSGHSKVKHILHYNLKIPQPYLISPIFSNKQSSLLFNLRSQCVNEFKSNFFTSYCPLCSKSNHKYEDTQSHALICEALKKEMTISQKQVLNTVTYNDIFSSVEAQFNITKVFEMIILKREALRAASQHPAYPGNSTGPDGG